MNLTRFAFAAAVSLGAASFSFAQVTGSAKLDGKAPEPQTLNIKNSDPFMHNIHSLSEVNPAFNQAQPNVDKKGLDVTNIKSPEYFHVKCDVHGWMSAYVAVFEHPYFAVTGEDGKYSFDAKQVPDGEYTLTAWHETLGKQEQKVTIKDGKAT